MSESYPLATIHLLGSSNLLTLIQDDLISENFHVKFSIRKETVQDVSAGLASGLNIQRADTNDT